MAIDFTQFHELVKMPSLGNLPNEIIVDILLRLPVKSICRFKCTSQPWKALLSSVKFAELHLAHVLAKKNDCLLLRHVRVDESRDEERRGECSKEPREVFSLTSKQTLEEFLVTQVSSGNNKGRYTIVGSCNGLVCLAESNHGDMVPFLNATLWNPTTRELRNLPRYHTSRFTGQVTLAGFGFMFDTEANNNLVVRIVYLTDGNSYEVKIYSARTNRWKIIESTELNFHYFETTISQVIMSGAIHWLVAKGETAADEQHLVLAFNVKEEKFSKIRLPEWDIIDEYFLHTTSQNEPNSSAESLSLIVSKPFVAYERWVLEEYGNAESWAKLYSIQPIGEPMKPLYVLDENRVLMQRHDDGQVVVCESNFRVVKELRVFRPVRIVTHVESLVSPHHNT